MLTSIFILIIGFVVLIKGADYFVDSSSSIAKKLRIPPMIIGLTIVAMGTSLPELSVSFTSALAGQSDMSIANAIGSNIMNILIIIGASSMIRKLPINKNTVTKDLVTLFLASVLLLVLAYAGHSLVFTDGFIMVVYFAWYIRSMIKEAKANPTPNIDNGDGSTPGFIKIAFFLILGIIGIILGGNLVVDSATEIAKVLGMSDNMIGLTVVALGTSLPELTTSIIATKKGEVEIAVGNVIGSNIFNILFVLGISSLFNVLTISTVTLVDIVFSIFTIMLLASIGAKHKRVGRFHGLIFIAMYIAYIAFTLIR